MTASEIQWITPRNQAPPILWRYMRFSALLLLLQRGRVYIPTIEELRRVDPTEATIVCNRTRRYFSEKLSDEDRDWLKKKADKYESSILNSDPAEEVQRVQMQIWVRELAKHRCAWCWFGGNKESESMALWTTYATHGIALLTTPDKLSACIERSLTTIHAKIGKMKYVNSGQCVGDGDEYLLRPYFFKKDCFAHEQEVRIIFPHPTDAFNRGLLLSLGAGLPATTDPEGLQSLRKELIERIVISPLIHRNEAEAMRDEIIGLLGNKKEDLVRISTANDIELTAADELKHASAYKNEISCFGGSRELPPLLTRDLQSDLAS